jgi:hypothetical protein
MDVKDYEDLFTDYFDGIGVIEYRGVPIRPGPSTLGGDINMHNCIGDKPTNCKKGVFCNNSIKQWQCL